MNGNAEEIWGGRAVLFKSFWGWSPGNWAALGWTRPGDRDWALQRLTDPFILVCNVTLDSPLAEEHERGKIVGFYLVSHEAGDRDEFTDPTYYAVKPTKWRHAVRAVRAFTYLPEYRLSTSEFDPSLVARAVPVATRGEIIADAARIARLRNTPSEPAPIYAGGRRLPTGAAGPPSNGFVRAGPENIGGYSVPAAATDLPRHLYILRLDGPTDAFLGGSADGKRIIKVGLAASPESRRAQFQAALPRGAFAWRVHRTTFGLDPAPRWAFGAAVAGEYVMKRLLAGWAKHLDGEFYLASDDQIDEAWRHGVAAANALAGGTA